jgi:hypothetical protein
MTAGGILQAAVQLSLKAGDFAIEVKDLGRERVLEFKLLGSFNPALPRTGHAPIICAAAT